MALLNTLEGGKAEATWAKRLLRGCPWVLKGHPHLSHGRQKGIQKCGSFKKFHVPIDSLNNGHFGFISD